MPGIVGLITKASPERAKVEVAQMVKSLCHKASYSSGTWCDEVLGIYIGWVAREGSFCDKMPVRNERGDVTLVFSGEEFPSTETRNRLKERGHSVQPSGSSYLAHLYEEDPSFLANLNGRFHGLVADHRRGEATLFVDRYGTHRLYYQESKDAFYFAAEAKAILAVRPELRRINSQALGEFVSCGCVLENRTLFESINVLPASAAWTFRNGNLAQKSRYFDERDWENQGALDGEAYYAELREVFSRNLPRYLNGTEPIGISLTGGLDTRMILAWRKALAPALRSYTFAGTYHDSQDVQIARQIANSCGLPHDVIRVGNDFLSRFGDFAERTVYLTDGCADVSRSPILYTHEQVANIAPIKLTGNYGSEILRRMVAFKPSIPSSDSFHPDLAPHFQQAKKTYNSLIQGHPVSFIAFCQVPWHHWGLLALEQTQVSPRSPYLDNDLVRTTYRAPNTSIVKSSVIAENDDCLRLIADGNGALSRIRTDRGLGSRGMSAFLSRALLEMTFRAEYEYDYGMRPWVNRVDHLASGLHLERLFLGRHKYYHFRVWYRDALAEYVKQILLDPRALSRPYVQRKRVESMVQGHVRGTRNCTLEIHKLLTLELFHRLFIDRA